MKYFTLREFEKSDTADKLKIDNSIPEEFLDNINELVDELLDPIREEWDSPIKINSGYRSPALNKAVKGSKTSSHCYALAADLWPLNRDINSFKEFIKLFLKDKTFDQVISEWTPDGKQQWVHISFKNVKGEQRKQFLQYKDGKYTTWK